ncbi:MAG: DUF790 family protein [Promethearchaeota archaeon]
MLPKSLLLVDFRGDSIKPRYLKNMNQAKQIISIFKEYVGKKYKELKKELMILESGQIDFKVLRGLAELVKRRCIFTPCTELDILKLRRELFEKGFIKDKTERDIIIKSIAREFGVSSDDIENAMFADLPKEQVLKQCNAPTPKELIKRYNQSMTQTLLFNATEVTLTVSANYQQIFRTINYLGLMYETDGNEIRISGPISLLKNTIKYGSSLAKLIPYIFQSETWSIKAFIQMERGNEPKIFTFQLSSNDHVPLPIHEFKEEKFDSEIEERFYKDFKLYASDWKIKREPAFIKAGNYIIIPDFGFFKNGMKLYLEVVGFWTPEYIQKKIKKFNLTDTKIIVAINQNLKCSRDDFPGNVIFYKKKIPIKPILEILKKEEEKKIKKEITENKNVIIEENIVDLRSKAKELNISPQALEQMKIPGYFIIGQKLVSNDFLEDLKAEIGKKREFTEIKQILDKYQLTDKALNLIGYKIVWNGLIPKRIIKLN